MPKKYHIATKPAPLSLNAIAKFKIARGENCINCGKCTKVCIYDAHKRSERDLRKIADPNTVLCKNCFRCIQECPRGALVKSLAPDFLTLGGSYWKPDIFLSLSKQAEDGKVPVSGAGYRGPFTGPGFDGMWTDMSEIVRPTRDGIHGREYISTSVDLGRKLNHLEFDSSGAIASDLFKTIDLPLPVIFDVPATAVPPNITTALITAAEAIGTFIVLPAAAIGTEGGRHIKNIIPLVTAESISANRDLIKNAQLVALEFSDALLSSFSAIRDSLHKISTALVIVRIQACAGVEEKIAHLAKAGAEIIHVVADYCGMDAPGPGPRYIKETIRAAHLQLVQELIRDEVTIIASGGIAMAEHVPKAIICGADLIALDLPLLIALGALLYEQPEKNIQLPKGIENIPAALARQRIVNLMGAWHSQLLEVMGAMGIREARRLRGETGRAIFFDEIDRDTFGKLFQQLETASL